MSGLLALLDDVAAIAKLAASLVDDIAAHAAEAAGKSAGIVIDDAAVTPKYVTGLPAAREIPIVAKIAGGSLISKLVILLLQAFAPGVTHCRRFAATRYMECLARPTRCRSLSISNHLPACTVLIADRGYDANRLRHTLRSTGIEAAFCRLKDFRRVATRYDELAGA